MTHPTQGEHAQTEASHAIAQLRHLYHNMVGGGVRDAGEAKTIAAGLLAPAIAALETAISQPAAPQGVAYEELPEYLTLAVDRWFAENTGMGGCSDKDVRELAALFYGVHHSGGRESVDDALAIVDSFGPGIGGLNDTYARQILLADEVKRLRASHGQAPAGAAQQPAATVIKKGADRQWMSERLGNLSDGIYSLYLAPQPTQAQAGAVPLTDEQCDAIYEALDEFGREVDHYEYGLPYCTSDGETLAKPEAREVIRQAAQNIKGADHG